MLQKRSDTVRYLIRGMVSLRGIVSLHTDHYPADSITINLSRIANTSNPIDTEHSQMDAEQSDRVS